MKNIVAIIAEYNPFHNGHLYQIKEVKNKIEADYIIAIMTGNFTQRGEPSLINKWKKAKMALQNEVDMVIELPTIFSVSNAEIFATGAIKIIKEMGNVTHIAFGVEDYDQASINLIVKKLLQEDSIYKEKLREELVSGSSFPKAREEALIKSLELDESFITETLSKVDYKNLNEEEIKVERENILIHRRQEIKSIIEKPNNILAIEYLKAIKKNKLDIEPILVERAGSDYLEESITSEMASGSAIRKAIKNKELTQITKTMPLSNTEAIIKEIKSKNVVLGLEDLNDAIIYKLRSMNAKELSNIADVSEGLENLMLTEVYNTNSVEDLIKKVKSKRYTQARIQRIIIAALLGITKKDVKNALKNKPYIRVLGMNNKGKEIISDFKGKVITSLKRFEDENKRYKCKFMLEKDKLASNIYAIATNDNSESNGDYTEKIITL